jgi:hypothetical protein
MSSISFLYHSDIKKEPPSQGDYLRLGVFVSLKGLRRPLKGILGLELDVLWVCQ